MTNPSLRSMKELARNVLLIQDACNLSGVVHSFSIAMSILCEYKYQLNQGTDWVNNHPVAKMYASKIHALSGMGVSDTEEFHHAYEACKKLAEE